MGFKRLYNNRSHDKDKASSVKPRTRAIIQPYSERKAKRLQAEAAATSSQAERTQSPNKETRPDTNACQSPTPASGIQSPGLSGADWRAIDAQRGPVEQLDKVASPIRLPPVTALEKDAYFGHKARAEFLDIFRQLSRQRHVYKDSKYDAESAVVVKPPERYKGTKFGRSPSGGRFTRGMKDRTLWEQAWEVMFCRYVVYLPKHYSFISITELSISEDDGRHSPSRPAGAAPKERGGMGRARQSGVQTFGQTGVMVRTDTKPDISVQESAQTEQAVFKSHLKITGDPGSFPRPLSPRSRFLLGCLNSDVVPRPSMLIRKELTYVLNLEHQYIGDHGGLLLANSLDGLPYLAELNVGDNNLTDSGLEAIIKALHMCPYLTSLDVSENKIDELAASALSKYLQKSDCRLINLVMRKSDVDDNEIGDFVQVR